MGLRADIERVFENNLSDGDGESVELSPFQRKKIKNLSNGLADAIIDFVQAQTFQITEMEATVDIEEIKTAAPLSADVLSSVTVVTSTGPGNVAVGTKGVLIPKLKLSKTGGQGGTLIPKAKAYIGPKSNKNQFGKPNIDKTKVKLLKVNKG